MQAKAVAGGLLAAALAATACFLWPSEASRVRALVTGAADAVSTRPGEGDLDRLVRLGGLAKALSPDVVVETGPGGPAIRGREAVAALAGQLSSAGGPQRVDLSDLDVTLDETSSHAVVTAVAHVSSAARGGGATTGPVSGFDGEVIRIELARTGDDWLITRACPEPALAR
jgi:hypothetical protein